jgi:hypothetical protein
LKVFIKLFIIIIIIGFRPVIGENLKEISCSPYEDDKYICKLINIHYNDNINQTFFKEYKNPYLTLIEKFSNIIENNEKKLFKNWKCLDLGIFIF